MTTTVSTSPLKKKSKTHLHMNVKKFDDSNHMIINYGMVIYGYEVITKMGEGAFGKVYLVKNLDNDEINVMKIVKNKKLYIKAACREVEFIKRLTSYDKTNTSNIVRLISNFSYYGVPIMIFERLGLNLFLYSKQLVCNKFIFKTVILYAKQILIALKTLKRLKIIHCDLKPENICVLSNDYNKLKIIDVGSSVNYNDYGMFNDYAVSRYYRPPEIPFKLPFDYGLDMWSLGCVIYELYMGTPLFPAKSSVFQSNLIELFIEVIGMPPHSLEKKYPKSKINEKCVKILERNSYLQPNSKAFTSEQLKDPIIELVSKCIKWESNKRITPREALSLPIFNTYIVRNETPLKNIASLLRNTFMRNTSII